MIAPEIRLRRLRQLIEERGFVRIIEAHSGISALAGERARLEQDGQVVEFDGFWESSLTDSASEGLPDVQIVGPESRIHTINEILEVTTKPIIVAGDTGGAATEFEYFVRRLERLGVSAVIIEDKVFPKRNSLDGSARQTLEDPELFAQKIERGKRAQLAGDFMVIARVESPIAGTGMADALARTEAYVKAGADGIMIHSQKGSPDEILEFAQAYGPLCERLERRPLLVSVPTTYNLITDQDLADEGFDVVIHANHLLRASYKAMTEAASAILSTDRGFEAESLCAPTTDVFEIVGANRVREQDRRYSKSERISIVIPAAGKDPVFPELPKSQIAVGGRPIIDHQIETLRKAGLTNNKVFVIRGHEAEQFTRTDVEYRDNDRYLETHSLYSLFLAEEAMAEGFVLIYSDILFNESVINQLIGSGGEIVLLIDSSYRYHKHDVDKKLDLVVSSRGPAMRRRRLQPNALLDLTRVAKGVPKEEADHEFVGIAYFSERGAEILRKVYHDVAQLDPSPFHEAPSFERAQITDILQEIIHRGTPVQGLEVSMGWIEIHNRQDVRLAEQELLSTGIAER